MQLLDTASKLDWNGWVRGVVGAFVSGGAGAIAAGFSANLLDKQHDLNVFAVMGVTFLISGVISLAKYLQMTPVPNPEQEQAQNITTEVKK